MDISVIEDNPPNNSNEVNKQVIQQPDVLDISVAANSQIAPSVQDRHGSVLVPTSDQELNPLDKERTEAVAGLKPKRGRPRKGQKNKQIVVNDELVEKPTRIQPTRGCKNQN